MGKQNAQCVPSNVATCLRWRIHFRAGVGVVPPHTAISSGAGGIVLRDRRPCGHLRVQVHLHIAPNLLTNVRIAGLKLVTVTGDPPHGD